MDLIILALSEAEREGANTPGLETDQECHDHAGALADLVGGSGGEGGGLTEEEELAPVSVELQQARTIVLDGQPHPVLPQQQGKLLDLEGAQLTPQLWGHHSRSIPGSTPIQPLPERPRALSKGIPGPALL